MHLSIEMHLLFFFSTTRHSIANVSPVDIDRFLISIADHMLRSFRVFDGVCLAQKASRKHTLSLSDLSTTLKNKQMMFRTAWTIGREVWSWYWFVKSIQKQLLRQIVWAPLKIFFHLLLALSLRGLELVLYLLGLHHLVYRPPPPQMQYAPAPQAENTIYEYRPLSARYRYQQQQQQQQQRYPPQANAPSFYGGERLRQHVPTYESREEQNLYPSLPRPSAPYENIGGGGGYSQASEQWPSGEPSESSHLLYHSHSHPPPHHCFYDESSLPQASAPPMTAPSTTKSSPKSQRQSLMSQQCKTKKRAGKKKVFRPFFRWRFFFRVCLCCCYV
jgi:hypothetical protein